MDEEQREIIRRDAYGKALKFKNTGLDPEAIYARLEKQGVPEDIAIEVAKNVSLHKKKLKDSEVPTPLNSYSLMAKFWSIIFGK